MKTLLRNTLFNAISLFVLSQLLSGVKITGGFPALILGGFVLSVIFVFLKPIFNFFSLPLNALTFGLFSFLSNAILLYLLTVLVPQIQITSFTFNGFSFAGFIIPKMNFNSLYAFVVSALVLSAVANFFHWIIKK